MPRNDGNTKRQSRAARRRAWLHSARVGARKRELTEARKRRERNKLRAAGLPPWAKVRDVGPHL